jgi:hypothetical protein
MLSDLTSVKYLLVTFSRAKNRRVFAAIEILLLIKSVVVVVTVPKVVCWVNRLHHQKHAIWFFWSLLVSSIT